MSIISMAVHGRIRQGEMERYNQRLLIKFETFQRTDGDDEIDSNYNEETDEERRRRRPIILCISCILSLCNRDRSDGCC